MDQWTGNRPFKGLLIGDSGTGKTACTSYLANEGYELFYADFDNGMSIVPKVIKNKESLKRIHYRTLTDKLHTVGGGIFCDGMPEAATTFTGLLSGWVDGGKSYGPIHTWGPDRVLVMDSMTFLGRSLLRLILFNNKRNGQKPWVGDYGDAMDMMENILALLYSDSIKCHVIVNAHITYISKETGEVDKKGEDIMVEKGYPSALGTKLPPKVGRYFDFVLLTKSITTSLSSRKELILQSEGLIELKCPAIELPHNLPLETGLAQIFKAMGIKRPGLIEMGQPAA
jgi:hypothetical protein